MTSFPFGDINVPIDNVIIQPNGTTNVGSILTFNTTFNPATFAASIAVDAIIKIWAARKERKLQKQQIALLNEMRGMLLELNAKADTILRRLDELPRILIDEFRRISEDSVTMGFMNSAANRIETYVDSFTTQPDEFAVNASQWMDMKESFRGLCQQEFRPTSQLKLIQYAEFLNFVSAGKDAAFISLQLSRASQRLEALQTAQAKKIADTYVSKINELAPELANLTEPIPIGNGLKVRALGFPKPTVNIGSTTKDLNDITVSYEKPDRAMLLRAWQSAIIIERGGLERNARGNNIGFERLFLGSYRQHLSSLEEKLQYLHAKLDELKPDITRFREMQELKQQLTKCSQFDFGAELKDARSYIKT